MTKSVKKSAGLSKFNGRAITYPEMEITPFRVGSDDGPMGEEWARGILGWEEETEAEPFGDDFDLKDLNGKKVRLHNNVTNRPFVLADAMTYASVVLRKEWQLNGETMIVSETGLCLDCQHRLVGVMLAVQEWRKHPDAWPLWTAEPFIECLVAFGASDDPKVVDTINTGKPRTLSDVIFRDSQYLSDISLVDRHKVSKVAEHAIRVLSHRLLAFDDSFSKRRTHSEFIDFVQRHPLILSCVQFVWGCENSEGSVSQVVPLGTAAALMYLMMSDGDDCAEYRAHPTPGDKQLTFTNVDKAEKFWEMVGNSDHKLFSIKEAYAEIAQLQESVSKAEKVAVVTKAWFLFSAGKDVTAKKLALNYLEDAHGVRRLAESLLIGTVDTGGVRPEVEAEAEEEKTEEALKEVPPKKQQKKKRSAATKGRSAEDEDSVDVGGRAWVLEAPISESWSGIISEIAGRNAKLIVDSGFPGAGSVKATKVTQLMPHSPLEA